MLPCTNPFLERLRDGTRELHRQAERALDLPRSMSSLDEYRTLVQRLLGFYAPLERELFRAAPPQMGGLDWASRRKVQALQADLAALGCGNLPVPQCPAVPSLEDEPQRIGAWYVVEGATLGGRVIGIQLQRHLGLGPGSGGGFFDVYGAQRERRWEEFCGFLAGLPPGQAARASAGAEAVFGALRDWLLARR